MDLAKESLQIKRKVLENLTDKDLYPYSKHYLQTVKERFNQYWSNHFSTIGLVGMNEACLNLFNKPIHDPEAHKFSVEVLEHMRDRLQKYQDETGNFFNLEATPAEGTSYRLAKIDKVKFSTIRCANEMACRDQGAEPFYTNSTHLPVNYTDDIFEALDLQDALQTSYTGGTVLHGFIGERMPSAEATKQLVKKIFTDYSLPYLTLSPTFSICPKHGYIAGEHEYCPKCDVEIGFTSEHAAQEAKAAANHEAIAPEPATVTATQPEPTPEPVSEPVAQEEKPVTSNSDDDQPDIKPFMTY
jgi:ribonucleoside-triphosphate reductase